ncbi:hypothetical protein L6164_016475 [Bauhinia variegata]|nr:hypothetical protein L6164_016475 [Bauhinia variegata]
MHYPSEAYVTDYFKILDFLVYNGDDVDLLVRRGIITSIKDNNEVLSMIPLCLYEIGSFPDDPVHKWKACVKTISIAAVVILVLTIVQTFCSVVSLFKS